MKASSPATLWLLLALSAVPARAQTDKAGADAVGASLADILSLATMGSVTTQDRPAQVTQSGSDYLVRLPLKGFSAPPDAAVDAVTHPLGGGLWDITSMTFPASGTVSSTTPKGEPRQIDYSIGEQAIHMRIDPSFVQPSTFAADLGKVTLQSVQGDVRSDQKFDRYIADGTLSSDIPGHLNFASRGTATNWHLTAHAPNGIDSDGLIRTLSGHFSIDGLDRAQGTRMMAAAHALMTGLQQPPASPGQPQTVSPEQRQELHALADALPGLLTKFSAEESLDDIRFNAGPVNGGTIGRVHLNMAGDTARGRLAAGFEVAADELAISTLPAETRGYIPHHFDLKAALSGVRIEPLIALLRTATESGADNAMLQSRFIALFADADARIGIENLTFDTGPMRLTGSARFVPGANGRLGAAIHISATGMDSFMAQAQTVPAMQQALPVMFMAKGMGRPEAGAVVWDIVMGDGPITINGAPFGQPAAPRR